MVSDKTKALVEKSLFVYDFKSRPFENMKNKEVIKELEHAIKFNKEIIIKWLPKIRIISPRPLKKMVKKSLEKKLKGLLESH